MMVEKQGRLFNFSYVCLSTCIIYLSMTSCGSYCKIEIRIYDEFST